MDPIESEQTIELEAAPYLRKDQNFYDQEPFSKILPQIAEANQIDLSRLRSSITHIVRRNWYGGPWYGMKPEDIDQRLGQSVIVDLPEWLRRQGIKTRGDIKKYKSAAMQVIDNLTAYPFWVEYLNTIDISFYQRDGSRKPENNINVPVESYASWVSKKLKLVHNKVLSGIEEVFPQDFSPRSPAMATVEQGTLNENRRWRILKAAELIKS